MKKSAPVLLVITLISFVTPILSGKVYAGDLGTLVRLDRTAISRATGGTICATPESTGTETQIQVVFPTGFTVNQTASNWTVTTTNLPSGSIALPGINTATAVSGQIVTFPSNDLSTSTEYCFNFASTNTLTTASSTGTHVGILRTMNASNDVVDYHAFGISLATSDAINVTATVAANPTDFQADLALTDPLNGTFSQSTTLTYTLTYGNKLSYPADITVEASWDTGTIQGNSTPTVDLLDYVIGSSSNAYNSSPPVVDSVNRKIDWTISAIPGNTTDQTVSFKLKTNDSYTGSLPVTFTVNGRTYGPGTVTPDSTVSSTYQYVAPITPTSTPGSTSATTSSSGTAATSTPTPTPTIVPNHNPTITDIQLRTVSSSEAAILVTTDTSTSVIVNYGTSIKNLTQKANSNTLATEHILNLKGLNPATRYYYKVTVLDSNGKITTSDLYVLDTAKQSNPPQILLSSLILTSNDIVLTDPLRKSAILPAIIIPTNTSYSFKFGVLGFEHIKSIKAIVRKSNILGLATFQAFASSDFVSITEIAPGEYIGKLQSNLSADTYNVIVQIQDFNGNIIEETLARVKTVAPFTVINAATKEPVEKAKIIFSFYNRRLKIYEVLSSSITPVKNPIYTEADGTVLSVLPQGKYRADVTALGYDYKTVEFEIDSQASNYPRVELKPLPFSVMTYIKYTSSTALDVFSLLRDYLHTLRKSIHFLDLIAFFAILLLVFLGSVSYARRLSVPLLKLPYFSLYFLERIIRRPQHTLPIHGKVTSNGIVIGGASVYLTLPNGKVIAHTTTNSDGEFFAKIGASAIKITFTKKGFKSITQSISKDKLDQKIEMEVVQIEKPSSFGFDAIFWYTSYITGSLFEAILILTLFVELLFTFEFGIWKVLPFIAVSLLNIFLWAANARATRS